MDRQNWVISSNEDANEDEYILSLEDAAEYVIESSDDEDQADETVSKHLLIPTHFEKIGSDEAEGVFKAKCLACDGTYSAASYSLTNLSTHLKVHIYSKKEITFGNSLLIVQYTHLQRKHPNIFAEYKSACSSKRHRSKPIDILSQSKYIESLMKFIISGMHPFSVVEQQCFKDYTYGNDSKIGFFASKHSTIMHLSHDFQDYLDMLKETAQLKCHPDTK